MSQPDAPVLTLINHSKSNIPVSEHELREVLSAVEGLRKVSFSTLECVYVEEDDIVRINKEHLNRDYITDVISFHYHEKESTENLEGTVVMCVGRISEQAQEFDASSEKQEFLRIAAHGMLHVSGLDDSSADDKKNMTELENQILETLNYA
jgi:rRNA maturation RNase YbeY